MALQGQAWENLKPFYAYLQAAIRAAKQRQVRYRVSWKPAEVLHTLRLKPCDSIHELVPADARFRVVGLPAGIDAESLPPKLIVDWTDFVDVGRVEQREGTVLIELTQAPSEKAQLAWAGHLVRVERVTSTTVPKEVFDSAGRSLPIIAIHPHEGGPRLVIAGESVSALYTRAGTLIPTHPLDWKEGLSELRTSALSVPFTESLELQVPTLPSSFHLLGNNGVRFAWEELQPRGRAPKGEWVQLLPLENSDAELAVDPRSAFCEEGVREVITSQKDRLRVFGYRRESWQLLLERLPSADAILQVPINLSNLYRQKDAIDRLGTGPLPHHRGLLQLLEDPDKTSWRALRATKVEKWYLLGDDPLNSSMTDGTSEQRAFVEKALSTPDFAFLEGPPGSGKTHAICELILQLIERGQRILLCSTTHVAVDNVLERLVSHHPQVEALRIGAVERVDERVRACQLDNRIADLSEQWQRSSAFQDVTEKAIQAMAEQISLASVNLTCGTTTGILAHPYLRNSSDDRSASTGRYPHFDVLIIDEASKTTFQEFLVPALLARRWIVVGDVQQLPPFTERQDLEASLEELSDKQPGPGQLRQLSVAHQRACLLLFRLTRYSAAPGRLRWLVLEPPEVLSSLKDELAARANASVQGAEDASESDGAHDARGTLPFYQLPELIRIVDGKCASPLVVEDRTLYRECSLTDLQRGETVALHLLTASWILVEPTLLTRCERWLPADLCCSSSLPSSSEIWPYRRGHWLERRGQLDREVTERGRSYRTASEVETLQQQFLREHSWAGEVGWRLSRTHQLSQGRNAKKRLDLEQDISILSPMRKTEASWAPAAMLDLRDVGLRSMLEALRLGRTEHQVRRRSALTEGMPAKEWQTRAVRLSYQHRMHPHISEFPREFFYENRALKDANTLQGRDERVGWRFGLKFPGRRTWVDVEGTEHHGINSAEILAMKKVLEQWKRDCSGPRLPDRPGGQERPWEIACLAFYNKQELAIRDMLRDVTGQRRRETRFELPHTEIVCGTVDRFQGREADMVLLTLRNTRRIGHLDSPNRLNVGITRARHLLLVFGRRSFYQHCGIDELEQLAQRPEFVKDGAKR